MYLDEWSRCHHKQENHWMSGCYSHTDCTAHRTPSMSLWSLCDWYNVLIISLVRAPLFCYYTSVWSNMSVLQRTDNQSHHQQKTNKCTAIFYVHIGLLSAKRILSTPSGLLLGWAVAASTTSKSATSLLQWDFKSLQPPLLAFSVQLQKDLRPFGCSPALLRMMAARLQKDKCKKMLPPKCDWRRNITN